MGDVNLDGSAEIADVVLFSKFLGGSETLSEKQGKAADMDYNFKLTVKDLTLLKRYLLSR